MDKYAIIADEIHKLVRISNKDDWNSYAWRIHEKDEYYWIPIQDHKEYRKNKINKIDPVCPRCDRKWYSESTKMIV